MFPVSDAGLGAVVYSLEVLMGLMGDHRRWRTMPWMVAGFGILVIPLGMAQVILIMLQPIAVGTWSTLALASAAGMRSEEHTSELQSLMRISYAVFCLKKKIKINHKQVYDQSN